MSFNRRKMEAERKSKADAAAAARRAVDAQVLVDAETLIAIWNERQARRMPLLFAPTIGATVVARHHFLWVYCPACRTTRDIDLRTLDRHRDAAINEPDPVAVLPLLPTSPALCGAGENKHRRRDAT
jgi:hypothetical protein